MNPHLLISAYLPLQGHGQHPCHCCPSPPSPHLPPFRSSANLPILAPPSLTRGLAAWRSSVPPQPMSGSPDFSSSFHGCSLPKPHYFHQAEPTSCLSGPLVFGWYCSQDSACGLRHSLRIYFIPWTQCKVCEGWDCSWLGFHIRISCSIWVSDK